MGTGRRSAPWATAPTASQIKLKTYGKARREVAEKLAHLLLKAGFCLVWVRPRITAQDRYTALASSIRRVPLAAKFFSDGIPAWR